MDLTSFVLSWSDETKRFIYLTLKDHFDAKAGHLASTPSSVELCALNEFKTRAATSSISVKIEMIKEVRARRGVDLRMAKDIVDSWVEKKLITIP